jgi:hypothetical protein
MARKRSNSTDLAASGWEWGHVRVVGRFAETPKNEPTPFTINGVVWGVSAANRKR